MRKYRIAYVCVHNSCRSQMAEALTKLYHSDFFEAFSAGTKLKSQINQDAVKTILELHQYNMNTGQAPKTLDNLESGIDILVTMGCNVSCPFIHCQHQEDWGLDDPSGKGKAAFIKTQKIIQEKILRLRQRIERSEIVLF